MKSAKAGLIALACLSLTACVNLYEVNFQASKPGIELVPKVGAGLEVVQLPIEEHPLAVQDRSKNFTMLGQSRFRTSDTVTARDLEAFSKKIGAEHVLSSKQFIQTRTNLVTRFHHLHGMSARGWVDGKYTNMRMDHMDIPYQAQELVDVYEFWATFFQKGVRPPVLP